MPDAPKPDPVVGKTIRFTWDGGPTKGETHEHVFNADGSVDYHKVGGEPRKGKPMHEKKYGAVKVTDKVYVVSTAALPATLSRSCSISTTTASRASSRTKRIGCR